MVVCNGIEICEISSLRQYIEVVGGEEIIYLVVAIDYTVRGNKGKYIRIQTVNDC